MIDIMFNEGLENLRYQGRNGMGKQIGLNIMTIEDVVELSPINGKGNIANGFLRYPIGQIDALIEALKAIRDTGIIPVAGRIKYYLFQVKEKSCLQEMEHIYDTLILARHEEEARLIADGYMQKYYDGSYEPVKVDERTYQFDNGNFVVQLYKLEETTKEAFIQQMLSRHILNPKKYREA